MAGRKMIRHMAWPAGPRARSAGQGPAQPLEPGTGRKLDRGAWQATLGRRMPRQVGAFYGKLEKESRMTETYVHLFYDDGHGCLRDAGAEPLSFYGGMVPVVGDLIVDRNVEKGMDRGDARNRTIHEVVARYIIPGEITHIHLVIEGRRGTYREREIVGE
jgi:hypothetical protein